ncbi:T9SS type B sorting domain-containing protein [Flavobacterium restrictum]|uniref:T9SS type B sorting domain-containing protein n=1 Tax=Flavobacterium restrictum TaxID=2594428 RepID=A0A553E1Z9_9FLAO|nr:T9SS type B sorting domain-containing protein [Flavobacterium restrictum]TRX39051.1 T9SS type B sorting domain-containing protein [Flavobacterium restrictum]
MKFLKRSCIFISFLALAYTSSAQNFKEQIKATSDSIVSISSLSFQKKMTNALAILKATGDQIYCPQTSLPIVTDFTITDPDNTSTDTIFIQISIGYNEQYDLLSLTGNHPSIVSKWDSNSGRLTLTSPNPGALVAYSDFIKAIKDVVYINSSLKPTGNRSFSISIDKASYFPTNKHFYEFVDAKDILWDGALKNAETKTYFGLKGYLTTITSTDEQQLVGGQIDGAGWIGGSDLEVEGQWKWMSGPEKGTVFFDNRQTTPAPGVLISNPRYIGNYPGYAFWNRSSPRWYEGIPIYEPNNDTDLFGFSENFAHICELGTGEKGSWNDLSYNGSPSGLNQQKGYMIEYGGMPNDPKIDIATSTSMRIPQITQTTPDSRCGTGSVTLQASTNLGIVNWYENETGGTAIATGNIFTTPNITKTQTYYVETKYSGCEKTSLRTPIIATIYNVPVLIPTKSTFKLCGSGTITMEAKTTEGTIYWYEDPLGSSLISVGTTVTRYVTANTTFYIEAVNQYCSNGVKIPIDVIVYDLPPTENQEVVICTPNPLTIETKLSGEKYLWSTAETTKTITVTAPGIYTVSITRPDPASCTITETINVIEHPAPEIKQINIEDNTITILLKNKQPFFEYSIDNIHYQASNEFTNVPSGLQTAYVREINSCSIDTETFIIVLAPKYFTPNNDNFNDVWKIKGIENYPEAQITIFDRYGKFITTLNATNPSWNGTLNGAPLPADDYWYVLKLDPNSPEKRGHFTLKR